MTFRQLTILSCLILAGCATNPRNCPTDIQLKNTISQTQLLTDLKTLASDAMAGRKPATQGSLNAQNYITGRFSQIGLSQFNADYKHPFLFGIAKNKRGVNLIGYKPGTGKPGDYIVVTAHYDHLGKSGSRIYNGADDNASGVSAMLAIAEYVKDKSTNHSIIFMATDAEEDGLFGAKEFVKNPPVPLGDIKFNLNLDMVSQGGGGRRLYVAGTRKNPQFIPLIEQLINRANVCLKPGHEGPQKLRGTSIRQPDWRNASDHAPFLRKKIPYLYFGVDLHRHYHEYTDTYENIDPKFFTAATETIVDAFLLIDQR